MKFLIQFFSFLLVFCMNPAAEKTQHSPLGYLETQSYKKLAPRYQEWLNKVTYIATPEEKEVFLQLPGDRDREMFIAIFWEQRDPTPGTAANEYRDEIENRFADVNRRFSRGTPRPGWMTDMGRITMTLGAPSSIESFENLPGLHPSQVWFYQGDTSLGVPPYFNITFFKRQGMGEWIIYDPVADGPSALLINREEVDPRDFRQLYSAIRKLAPTLATPSISMIPNQVPFGYTPLPQNSLILANIFQSPLKKLNNEYADGFLKYKGLVSIENSTRFIECSRIIRIFPDPVRGGHFIHLAVKPKKITVDFSKEKDQYFFHFRMITTLKKDSLTLFQQSRNFDYYLDSKELDILQSGGLILADILPLVPGDFQLEVFLENQVGKEFSFFDFPVSCPSSSGGLRLAQPVLGGWVNDAANNFLAPFQFSGKHLAVDPIQTFSRDQSIFLLATIENRPGNWQNPMRMEWEISGDSLENQNIKGEQPLATDINSSSYALFFEIPFLNRLAGYYRLQLRLVNESGISLATRSIDFSISPAAKLPRPTEVFQQAAIDNPFQVAFQRGLQYFHLNRMAAAEDAFNASLTAMPGFHEAEKMLLETQLRLEKYQQVLDKATDLKQGNGWEFDRLRIMGDAYRGLGRNREALETYLAANRINNADFQLINRIGRSYLELNNRPEALKAFEASLKINPRQPEIADVTEKLRALTSDSASSTGKKQSE